MLCHPTVSCYLVLQWNTFNIEGVVYDIYAMDWKLSVFPVSIIASKQPLLVRIMMGWDVHILSQCTISVKLAMDFQLSFNTFQRRIVGSSTMVSE